jgi:hypothetical protein
MAIALLLGAISLVACWPDRLSDKACNDAHPCVDGYVCLSEVCYEEERVLFDGGLPPDAGQ